MKKILVLFGALVLAVAASAQNTTVSATVVDSDGTAWANGTWSITLTPGTYQPDPSKYTIGGNPVSPSVINQSGALDASGAFSVVVYQTAAISPIGSTWTLTVCPNAVSACSRYQFQAFGTTLNISSALTTAIVAPRFNAISGAYGYNDTEAQVQLKNGSTYFNVTLGAQRCYMNGAWVNCGLGPTIRPSGDTTGVTDNAAIQAAINTGQAIQLATGSYYITGLTCSQACVIKGNGPDSTSLFMVSTTNNFFTVNYGGGQLNTQSSGTTISDMGFFYKTGVTPTAGYALSASGVDSTHYLSGIHFENNHLWGLFGGIHAGAFMVNNWFTNNLMVDFLAGGNGGIYYDTPSPGGDAYFDGDQLVGTNTGVFINQADTFEFTNLKTNGSGVVFGGTAGSTRVRFINPSIEGNGTIPACGVTFDAGSNVSEASFTGGGIGLLPQAFCNNGSANYSYNGVYFYNVTTVDGTLVPSATYSYLASVESYSQPFNQPIFLGPPYTVSTAISYSSIGCTVFSSSCYPDIVFSDSLAATNEKATKIYALNGSFGIQFLDDSFVSNANLLTVTRSGITPTSAVWGSPLSATIFSGSSQTVIASASTIAPTAQYFHVSGTAAIATITPTTFCTTAGTMCQITIIPDGIFTTTTAGNIALASTAVVSKALIMTYDPGTSKWYPSY